MLTVAGGGMAGLAAAARARELGVSTRVLEKGSRAGGSMLLSSCVIWRYRTFELYREECPAGDPLLQEQVVGRLDEAIAWLESLGAPVATHETGNPRTVGKRFDPVGLTQTLVRAAGGVELDAPFETGPVPRTGHGPVPGTGTPPEGPVLLSTGGFQGSRELVARYVAPAAPLRLRANPWSAGAGLEHGLEAGAALSAGMAEFYGRNMADVDFGETEFVPLAQLYGSFARVFNERGEEFFDREVSWSENDLVQATARQPGARAFYVVGDRDLGRTVRERTVRDLVEAAPSRVPLDELPFDPPAGAAAAVRVAPAITHTIGGLRIDARARVLDSEGERVDDLYAAGADAGGLSTGGYASGLAAALVFGFAAAEDAAR